MKLHRTGRLLAFGGCYSNLQATEALLAQARQLGIAPANMVCTGDIIAYAADAHATLSLLRAAGIASIKGNCEEQLSQNAGDCGCGFAPGSACDAWSTQWYAHAAAQITADDRHYMASLPGHIEISLAGKRLRFVHGNVERINAYVFPSASNLELEHQLNLAGCDVLVAGHSGIPFIRHVGNKIWHNAGSIGMPANDGTPEGWFSVIEVVNGAVQITPHRLGYNHHKAARAMRKAGLPEPYARALETGLWPSLDILPAAERALSGAPLQTQHPQSLRPTAPAAPTAHVGLARLDILWVNTGTLCNISCTGCFMDSTPTNDSLAYFTLNDFNAVLTQAPATLHEIGFTGGEPFMNPHIMPMLEAALAAGKRVLILTNAMRPMQRHAAALANLVSRHPGRISIRVSLDHYHPAQHDALRGAGSFTASLAGLQWLNQHEFALAVASRTPWGETEPMMRDGFAALFAAHQLNLNAYDAGHLTLFPEMHASSALLDRVNAQAFAASPAPTPPMCANARMVLRRKQAPHFSFSPCTLRPELDLGPSFATAATEVALNHSHCAQFCVFGGASCARAG